MVSFRLALLYLAGYFIVMTRASLPPVSTSDRIVFKGDNMNEEMREQVKYTFFLIETDGTVEDTCGYLKERFDKMFQEYKWTCAEGVVKITTDDESPYGMFEYLPPGLGFSIKGVYISYDGSLQTASTYLLLSRPKLVRPKEQELVVEDKLQVFFFNTPYFFAIFMSFAATVIIWRRPISDLPNVSVTMPRSS